MSGSLDSVVDYAIYNYIHSQEFWNQFVVFGHNVFNFEMSFENLFFYCDYSIKEINIEFALKEKNALYKRDVTYLINELYTNVTINYIDLFVDLMFLTEGYYFGDSYPIRNIYVKENKLYNDLEISPELCFYFDLDKYFLDVDVSSYNFCGSYVVNYIDDLNFLNTNIQNKNNISIKYKALPGHLISFLCKVYGCDQYKSIEIDLSDCSLDLSQQILNSLIDSNIKFTDNKIIRLNRHDFHTASGTLCINDKCKVLMETSLKYFSKVLLV